MTTMATMATMASTATVRNDNDVDDVDDDNLLPRIGKRNDGCNETKTGEEERVTETVKYTQQSNRSRGGGVIDGNDYDVDDKDDEGSGHDDDNDDNGGYGGRDGHHRMRKGRQHDNKTIHNIKLGKH